jgi:hypothetical protein
MYNETVCTNHCGCTIEGCNVQKMALYQWNGKQYCDEHYRMVFVTELETLFRLWDGSTTPDYRLRYLIGRYYNDYGKDIDRNHWLTQSIIATRSSDWKKTVDGVEFTALKRPVARYDGFFPIGEEVYQTWRFNMNTKAFTFMSERFGEEVWL